MQKIEVFDVFSSGFTHTWKHQLLQGILFILFAISIVVFPQLLAVMVASFFGVIGILLISSAWALRKFSKQYSGFRNELFDLF